MNLSTTSLFALVSAPGLALALAISLAACQGCKTTGSTPPAEAALDAGPPTLRLYLVSDMAGALEPCGCTKDQLGGLDHLGAWMTAERPHAPASALVTAGPLFFMDSTLKEDRAAQDKEKAETIARALKGLGMAGFAPGANDWAAGRTALLSLADLTGAPMLLANHPPAEGTPWKGSVLRDIGGVKVGFVGVGEGEPGAPAGATVPPQEAVRAGVDALRKQGAQVLIVLAAVGRGEAKRIADVVPELTAVLVGSTQVGGESNTNAPPAERIGNVLIAETGNHLQRVAVLDLFVRETPGGEPLVFADATGIERSRQREELTRRIDDLRVKIAAWERDGKIAKSDLEARRADLARIEQERAGLDAQPPPPKGSFFRYTVKEVRESLGKDPQVGAEMLAYYKKVNERNRVAFADRTPRPHTGDQPTYIGVEACSACHPGARQFWNTTAHAHAYKTLSDQFKEFNLDCVSCHVTGYDQPGGSTVTHVDRLKDVQCEVCHGPGSKHGLNPADTSTIIAHPQADRCLTCHHPPHVEQFDPNAKMADILGPGHGRPLK